MDDKVRIDYEKVKEAKDRVITTTSIYCPFFEERIVKKVTNSKSLGMEVTEDYEWEESYNNKGKFGGYELRNKNRTVKKVE